ncbi:MAG TPA: type II toxin-antitoxin system antitoxin SocA domain-containing protein [Candidatus Paceibacterota bacterium]
MSTKYASLVKALRLERELSQAEVAEKLSLSRQSYMAVERGSRELTLEEAERLCRLFGITMSALEGGQAPNYEKYKQMIHAFLRLNKHLTKTKLAKLLYLADFSWYYTHLKSMSGMPYRKIQYGPVADAYFGLIDQMADNGEISIDLKDEAMLISETRTGARTELYQVNAKERELIEKIDAKWKNKKTTDIVGFTHKQLPYLFAEENGIVSYEIFTQEDPSDIY